ncbi:hypothetical protein [Morganella sp. EGD-HP17]|uniref:hypothetical protein n=1 Tax=Morganella sp. EGD-HP17 TaxID=1435146 RepID=UPI0004137D30|nr:hypothetical protein [Morganella sp. EGD-HP17]ETO41302.1 hypothetical protein X965_10910 [Morganella sp. EGD-HP17]
MAGFKEEITKMTTFKKPEQYMNESDYPAAGDHNAVMIEELYANSEYTELLQCPTFEFSTDISFFH